MRGGTTGSSAAASKQRVIEIAVEVPTATETRGQEGGGDPVTEAKKSDNGAEGK